MKLLTYIAIQLVMILSWYSVPGMALCPAFLVFLPTIVLFLLIAVALAAMSVCFVATLRH